MSGGGREGGGEVSDGVIRPQTSEKPSSPLPVKPIVALRKKLIFFPFLCVFLKRWEKTMERQKERKKKGRGPNDPSLPPQS